MVHKFLSVERGLGRDSEGFRSRLITCEAVENTLGPSTLLHHPRLFLAQARVVETGLPTSARERAPSRYRLPPLDFVVANTAINAAPSFGPYYQTGQVECFTSLMPNENGRLQIDHTITSTPQTTVVFACKGRTRP